MSPTYWVRCSHPVDIACGQMVGPGEDTKNVNPKHPHDKTLIADGQLVERSSKRQPRKTKKQEDSQ